MNSAMIFGLLTLVVLYSVSGEKTTEQIEVRHMTDSSSKKNKSKMFPFDMLYNGVCFRIFEHKK